MKKLIDKLLRSEEPSIRYKVLVNVLGEGPQSRVVRETQNDVRRSPRVRDLLAERGAEGTIPFNPYSKWRGAHWVLATLADIGYPAGDRALTPLREQVLGWLLSDKHTKSIPTIDGRVRRCGSQEGNALFAVLALGLADERADELARRLIKWQWPDGGWNCDRRPEAANSSYNESFIPLRALTLYTRLTGDGDAKAAVERAAEVFLKRRLFKRLRDGSVIHPEFARLHYPPYWHYDVLAGLKSLADAGFVTDNRCEDALDLLESKRLPGGGWPSQGKYYRYYPPDTKAGAGPPSRVDWGPTGKTKTNEWVTADALYVLRKAGRLEL
ncbi:MAG: hypothetical protein PVH29_14840 [Candidatus Zixiibacteriota bacterium]|jgi:hypothetical protein